MFHIGSDVTPIDNVPMTFYVIFVIHTMLPTQRRVSFSLGILTALMDLITVGVLYKPVHEQWKVRPVRYLLVVRLTIYLQS